MTTPGNAGARTLSCDTADPTRVLDRYRQVRDFSETLAAPLSSEDCCIQSMPDVSPTKWHLAHTSWFFETFLLEGRAGYEPFDPQFRVLFNSYYNGVGEQFPRPQRGLLSRPSLADVLYYRQYVDEALHKHLANQEIDARTRQILEIGLQHEQQHQELILTDIKHVLAQNPLLPVYREGETHWEGKAPAAPKEHRASVEDSRSQGASFAGTASYAEREAPSSNQGGRDQTTCGGSAGASPSRDSWQHFDEGLYEIGHAGDGFAYDNESPRHRAFLEGFSLTDRTVTCGQWLQFMQEGGYEDPRLWLSLGWSSVQEHGWQAPLYWFERDGRWWQFTLAGAQPIGPDDPVCHVSYFEADAFARWCGARLPTEAEWEVAAADQPIAGNFVDTLLAKDAPLHPRGSTGMFGNVWEWTASPYTPYPGYAPPDGALGEYNGKFMSQQYVLRGGSVATHSSHIRPTYRNFFPPEARWQFSGLRLAR
jgi:formylglycine-generating enzyme required for sulfatase activity